MDRLGLLSDQGPDSKRKFNSTADGREEGKEIIHG